MPESSDPRCECGHRQSEHDRHYTWTSLVYCGGTVFAVDHDPDDRMLRERGCGCNGFTAADEYQVRAWDEEAVRA